jgi:hypothetical protein
MCYLTKNYVISDQNIYVQSETNMQHNKLILLETQAFIISYQWQWLNVTSICGNMGIIWPLMGYYINFPPHNMKK